ncbi:MAG TPA: HAD family hydrolase [Dehalococcoidia bacterium]|jgi:putative hydrolase of the HAD superfamily|nr:HAD family hydrolase [Dehalococcoidia bacterium]
MRLPEAIIFDLDDTIVDDSAAVAACWDVACAEGVARLDGLRPDVLMAAIERERDWYWSDPARHREGRLDLRAASSRIVVQALERLGFPEPELGRLIANRYRDLREEVISLLPGAIETLEHFRGRGVRLGMATNGSAVGQRAKIERFELGQYFERIIVEEEFGVGKPHREVYEALFRALGAPAEKTWCVGDNLEWDVGGPQALGAYGIWVDVAGEGLSEYADVKPDRTIRSISELAS